PSLEEDHDEAAFRAKLASIARANREAAGLSPGEAARRAHISRAAVLDVEGRRSWPRVDTLVAYARAIGTTPWALLRRAHVETDDEPSEHDSLEPRGAPDQLPPVDLNAILREARASEQTWRTAKALLEALVAAER
ncbi:MAG TPA: helix-turn-helix transcriptional regulator, partial [Enhygromyxa sp.]|nr:helix-turn-helix transcriptional regulator [Enhygromyxa sp.]